MTYKEAIIFKNYLFNRLKEPLPGIDAHKIMAPKIGIEFFRTFQPKSSSSHSSVLAVFTVIKNRLSVLLTLRSQKLKSHRGQISFPGGRVENNETLSQAALRETHEEVGISINENSIIGKLSELYVPPSDSIINPFIAWIDHIPEITVNDDEVEEAFWVDFEYIANKNNVIENLWDFDGNKVIVPHWSIHPKTPLWGATAMILAELIILYNNFTDYQSKSL